MRNYQFLSRIILISISIFQCGCQKDFLNIPTSGQLIRQDYVKDISTTQEFLNGIYVSLPRLFASYYNLYADIVSDNLKPVVGSNMFQAQYNWMQQEDDKIGTDLNMNAISYSAYNIILGCNFVIEKADEFKSENEQIAHQLKGQALALRAFTHFYLVNHFAQPYRYTPQANHPGIAYVTSSDWTTTITRRNTVSEVYQQIVADLESSIKLLSPADRNTLYFSHYAAKALLARVNLFRNHFREASALSREVAAAVPLMTDNYPQKLFTLQETEALFQLPQNELLPVSFASYYLRGSILFLCTSDMAKILNEQPADVRRSWVNTTTNGWTVSKYPEGIIPNIPTSSISYYHTAIRSSEMYLNAAESYAQMGITYEDSARYFLDAVRLRANPQATASGATGAALLDSVYKERRKEFAFEGHRMFDLLRWGKGVNREDALSSQSQMLPYPSDKAIAPIPGNDVNITGLEQNSGY